MSRPSATASSSAGDRPDHLLRAGAGGWEVWRLEGEAAHPVPLPEAADGEETLPGLPPATALAMPLRLCLCLRLELPSPEGSDPLESLPLELEAQGLTSLDSPASWSARPLGAPHAADDSPDAERLQRVQVILATEEALDLAREMNAPEALCSALTLPLPADGLSLWRELGRPVCAVTRNGDLIHAQALGSPRFDRAAALEVVSIQHALTREGVLPGGFSAIHLFDEHQPDAGFVQALGRQPKPRGELPAPRWPAAQVPRPPLPHLNEAADVRRQRQRRRLFGAVVAGLVLLWLGYGAAQWLILSVTKNRLESQLAELRPRSEALVETNRSYLEAVAPLLLDDQPLEFYLAIHSLQPPGVRLERLDIDAAAGSLELRGIADTAADALELQGRLESAPAFQGWTWENRSPNLDASGSAEFRFNATR